MANLIRKDEFMAAKEYSASTYARRMKKFKSNPKYRGGYVAQTSKEVYIDTDIYEEFTKDESAKRLGYQRLEKTK